ncbi:uncharacterized protein V1518DRAFT_422372 [Limtongia smithiae]|uniref:uncharacterized protein n=1 Tax=Limtongia smithiae TaxID=1125753 RepID=UPI0034CE94A2
MRVVVALLQCSNTDSHTVTANSPALGARIPIWKLPQISDRYTEVNKREYARGSRRTRAHRGCSNVDSNVDDGAGSTSPRSRRLHYHISHLARAPCSLPPLAMVSHATIYSRSKRTDIDPANAHQASAQLYSPSIATTEAWRRYLTLSSELASDDGAEFSGAEDQVEYMQTAYERTSEEDKQVLSKPLSSVQASEILQSFVFSSLKDELEKSIKRWSTLWHVDADKMLTYYLAVSIREWGEEQDFPPVYSKCSAILESSRSVMDDKIARLTSMAPELERAATYALNSSANANPDLAAWMRTGVRRPGPAASSSAAGSSVNRSPLPTPPAAARTGTTSSLSPATGPSSTGLSSMYQSNLYNGSMSSSLTSLLPATPLGSNVPGTSSTASYLGRPVTTTSPDLYQELTPEEQAMMNTVPDGENFRRIFNYKLRNVRLAFNHRNPFRRILFSRLENLHLQPAFHEEGCLYHRQCTCTPRPIPELWDRLLLSLYEKNQRRSNAAGNGRNAQVVGRLTFIQGN